MYSFYMFEGSCWQGGGGWEHLEVSNNLEELDASVAYYVRTGSWAAGHTFVIRVYRHGELLVERELDPFLTVKVPGLTPMRSAEDGRTSGGVPEPGGPYDGMDEDAVWEVLPQEMYEIASESPEAIEVGVDWDGLALPELVPPALPTGADVTLDGRELRYGRNSTLDG
ncbi:hypothetical protein B7755_018500 [Streptomyces sp. NBS 14/10]|uniref:hypothetical protein n=1 Tax=Streptomyces sp. NBS 14/10 TaxID=1945643 RepID=UPI000B7D45A7|nr:hypothetical protein [Streptomyces sp. NBS 14/10]KAK1179960.1 hypothetical protein B7755_018500 [Streptomyces sp. NBS 14/10]